MKFRLRLWPTIGTIVGVALLMSLGTWQFDRYRAKAEIDELREERATDSPSAVASLDQLADNYSTVELNGELDPGHLFLFKHRTREGKPGGWLGAVMRLEERGAVLVNLGWVHREHYDRLSPELLSDYGSELTGLLHQPSRMVADEDLRRRLAGSDELPHGELLELDSYDLTTLQRHYGAAMPEKPTIVVLSPTHSREPYPVASFDHVTQPYLTAGRHLSYAVFWYVTGLALLAMYIANGLGYLGSGARRSSAPTDQ